jgi:hypothetical protein
VRPPAPPDNLVLTGHSMIFRFANVAPKYLLFATVPEHVLSIFLPRTAILSYIRVLLANSGLYAFHYVRTNLRATWQAECGRSVISPPSDIAYLIESVNWKPDPISPRK